MLSLNFSKLFLATVLATVSFSATAGNFCVVSNTGKYCNYWNLDSCRQDADSKDGDCVADVPAGSGNFQYCVVTANSAACHYSHKALCKELAASQHGACLVNPNN